MYTENSLVGPAPADNNTTPGFGRFCSGFLGGPDHGYDRPIYFTGEEVSADADSFAPGGGQSVAVFDREIHTLPRLGRFAKENSITLPGIGSRTVIFPTEDGPSTPDSQLYMYVGQKNPQADSMLGRNGLDNDKLYVLVLDGHSTEADFTAGSAAGRWVEIPDAAALSAEQLEAAADRAGAFGFVRIEDAATRGTDNLFFVTTGGTAGVNELGRGYRLTIKPGNPTAPATLSVVFNADATIAAGGDTAISPDNIDIAGRYLMVQEDGTTQSRAVMAAKGRDGSIWRIDLDAGYTARRIAELNPPGRDGTPVGPGVWESSGIVAAPTYGADSWLLDVQAHPPTAEPSPGTVEDGQLLLLRRKS